MPAVFDVYSSRLGAKLDAGAELTKRDITKSAEKALKSLEHFNDDATLAVDRAYANGEAIEKNLDLLVNSLNAAASAAHHVNTGSRAGGQQPSQAASNIAGAGTIQSAIAAIGLGQTILAEVRTIVKISQERIACFKEKKALVAEAHDALTRVAALCDNIRRVLTAKPNTIPQEFFSSFNIASKNIKGTLTIAAKKLNDFLSPASSSPASSKKHTAARAGVRKMQQFTSAKSISQCLRGILGTANRAEGTLQHQLTQLCSPVQSDRREYNSRSVFENYGGSVERFRPAFNAPALLPKIRLDFDSKDSNGRFFTPEGKLRHSVFVSTNTNVTVARGSQSPIHGVSGMAGVGKTIALNGLGHNPKIRSHFTDGVLYTTVEHVTAEVSKILRLAGAISRASGVESAPTLLSLSRLPGSMENASCSSLTTYGQLEAARRDTCQNWKHSCKEARLSTWPYLLGAQ